MPPRSWPRGCPRACGRRCDGVSDANKQIIRNLENALNSRDFDAAGDLLADSVSHQGVQGSRALFMRTYKDIRETFPDYHATIDRLFAEDDWVIELKTTSGSHLDGATTAHHGDLRGVEPTGKSFSIRQAHFWRICDGKIIEHEVVRDDLGLLRQLGLASERPGATQ